MATLEEREVHAAFRRQARASHPDSSGFTSTSVDFRELVRARDDVLSSVRARTETSAPPERSETEADARAAAWRSDFISVGMLRTLRATMAKGLRCAVRKHVLRSRESHAYYTRLAACYDATMDDHFGTHAPCGTWLPFISECIREYHAENTRCIRIESTIDSVFDGDVHIWTDSRASTSTSVARRWLIPLWHSALYIEDAESVFVVDIRPVAIRDICKYVHVRVGSDDTKDDTKDEAEDEDERLARENIVGFRHSVSGDTNDVELRVDVRSFDVHMRFLHRTEIRVGATAVLRLDSCPDVTRETRAEAHQTQTFRFENMGPYVPDDDDIFHMERRSTVVVVVQGM